MKKRIIFFLVLIFGFLCWFFYQKGNTILLREFGVTIPDTISVIANGHDILPEDEGRVNVLLLGVGGDDHEGGDLTDTIILSSFGSTTPSAVLISIPRDLWDPNLQDKINSAYHYGETMEKGTGLTYTKKIFEELFHIPVHYTMFIDFSRFQELVDAVGGISVNVSEAFTDNEYPIAGKETDDCGGDPTFACRYMSVSFEKGWNTMDGTKALMYVRSRHAMGTAGNDFSRGKRQQEVLISLKDKLFSPDVLFHPKRLMILFQVFRDAIKTDMSLPEFIALGKMIMMSSHESVGQMSLESELQSSVDQFGRFVLVPSGTYEDLSSYIRSSMKKPEGM